MMERRGGILLHPTSLPGPYGIGDVGKVAWAWLDWLAEAGCGLWQVLPLGPTGYGNSPYQSFSAFAGNPLLIALDMLVEDGLLDEADLASLQEADHEHVDYDLVRRSKMALIDRAWAAFRDGHAEHLEPAWRSFCEQNAAWLEDYALYMGIKGAHEGRPWYAWEPSLAGRQATALEEARQKLVQPVQRYRFEQFVFSRQWALLRERAKAWDITIIGDLPIFVAHDSADVWAYPDMFKLDEHGQPTVVAGVPPDYFSSTGQLWGNPVYRWDVLKEHEYAWWINRLRQTLELVDVVRLDHFRGFEAYWEVPAGADTAEAGAWAPGPGADFFDVVRDQLGELPMVAEDLGVITPEVVELRERFELPGMKVLQFAFEGDPRNPYLPHRYAERCVAYTGTHDNDTSLGWYRSAPPEVQDFCRRYLATEATSIAWDLIRAAWSSVALWGVAPLQDLLELDSRARMNVPSQPEGNWRWRARQDQLGSALAATMRELNFLYGRLR